MTQNNEAKHNRLRPSILAMFGLLPLALYPLIVNKNYREAFIFIIPGLPATLILILASFLFAFLLGLLLLKMRRMDYCQTTTTKFL